MNLQTKIAVEKMAHQIGYQSQLLLLGSCFAERLGRKFEHYKFQSIQNPFGILFHPLAIENLITRAVRKETYTEQDIFFLNERWHCYDAHSDLSDVSAEKLLQRLQEGLESTGQQLRKATHIFITLGTAWAYRNNESNNVVANCHKVPQRQFSKEILAVDAIVGSLRNSIESIQSVNEIAQVIFTVSPVRHLKDGFVENQRSKAHLITAVHQILNFRTRTSYFPSYEIMIDELRDYRFYETDMVHPNQLAIDYIWEKFMPIYISEGAQATMVLVEAVQKGLQHRPFNVQATKHQEFLKALEEKIAFLRKGYPFIVFNIES